MPKHYIGGANDRRRGPDPSEHAIICRVGDVHCRLRARDSDRDSAGGVQSETVHAIYRAMREIRLPELAACLRSRERTALVEFEHTIIADISRVEIAGGIDRETGRFRQTRRARISLTRSDSEIRLRVGPIDRLFVGQDLIAMIPRDVQVAGAINRDTVGNAHLSVPGKNQIRRGRVGFLRAEGAGVFQRAIIPAIGSEQISHCVHRDAGAAERSAANLET